MFSLARKIKAYTKTENPPAQNYETADDGIARIAINEDGEILFASPNFKSLNLSFDWIDAPGGRRVLIGSLPKDEPTMPAAADTFGHFTAMSRDLMITCDAMGNIQSANPATLQTLGLPTNKIQGAPFIDLLHEEDRPYVRNAIQSLNLGEMDAPASMIDFEARILTGKGQERWIEWRQQQNGETIYCCGRDVTDLKAQQTKLERHQKELSEAESIGRMGHWNWVIGHEHIDWSDEIYRIFGLEKDSFEPTMDNMNAMVDPEDIDRINQALQRAVLSQNGFDVEFRIERPDSEERFIRCEGRCQCDDEGEAIALYGIMQDMTERILYERDLKEAKNAAERAYNAKTQFLANMSHELRTPLNAIIGFSEMMQSQLLGPIGTEKYLEYVDGIRSSGGHLLDLISDILDMSKIEAGKYELDLSQFTISKVLSAAVHMMESRALENELRLGIEETPDDSVQIVADRRAVLQIVLNLLSNAVKFSKKGGQINLSCAAGDNHIAIIVADDGIGIPANKLATITSPFEQVSSSYARDHEGTGLGLSITKDLVEMHGGALKIESQIGEGTTVTVKLPLKAKTTRHSASG